MPSSLKFVSAGAGSGKTYRLTRILYENLKSGRATPAGVIATTFTRKAAAELRERVRSALLEEGEFALSNAMGQARIGTVNSVCGEFVERFALHAGLAPEQRVLEEVQAAKLVREAIDDVSDRDTVRRIVELAGRLCIERWQDELKLLMDHARANDIAPERLAGFAERNGKDFLAYFDQPSTDNLDAALVREIERGLPVLKSGGKGTKKTAEYVGIAQETLSALRQKRSTWAQWVKLSKSAPEAGLAAIGQSIAAAAGRYVAHPRLRSDISGYLETIFSLAARALDAYARRKRELGVIDFVDQEHLFLKLLTDRDVVSALSDELELLLVDEFQDTSPIQLELFLRLAEIARETVWVGDVKQAIYGFRGSDAELMKAVLRELPRLNGSQEILDQSRRSRPHLVHLVNSAFVDAFAPQLSRQEIELRAVREERLTEPAFATWLLEGNNAEQRAAALTEAIRSLIASGYRVVDPGSNDIRPAQYGDIAVLSKTNDGVAQIASALRAASVPWATDQPGLLATPEAVLALACLRRFNDPRDTVGTAEIVSLADSEEPESWLADRLRFLDEGGNSIRWREAGDGAHPIVATIARLRNQARLVSPRVAMELIITQCDLPARVLRWNRSELVGRVRLANLQALIELARGYEDACAAAREPATLSGLLLWFQRQVRDRLDLLAQPAVDAVKVLTHHAAKGLEWPIVIIYDLEKEMRDRVWSISARSDAPLDLTAPLKERWIRYWPWPFGLQRKVDVADRIAQSAEGARMHRETAEEAKRLLYVTMTRARDFLVIALPARSADCALFIEMGAPWLAGKGGRNQLRLPGGDSIPYILQVFDPPGTVERPAERDDALRWFKRVDYRTERLPAVVLPSAAAGQACAVLEVPPLGTRVKLEAGVDMTALGSGVHACVAAALVAGRSKFDRSHAARILQGFGVDNALDPAALVSQIESIEGWIRTRWPNCRRHPEIPIEAVLSNGQTMQGRIDLLLEVEDKWILIDHKSNPAPRDRWGEVAAEHAGQLFTYASALRNVSDRPVSELWILLPIAGGAVRIAVPNDVEASRLESSNDIRDREI